MIEAALPFSFEFAASQYTALISATRQGAELQVDVWSDLDGNFQKIGGFGGSTSGKTLVRSKGAGLQFVGNKFLMQQSSRALQ